VHDMLVRLALTLHLHYYSISVATRFERERGVERRRLVKCETFHYVGISLL